MKSSEEIRREFLTGGMDYVQAVLALESLGMDQMEAVARVCEWDGYTGEPTE